MPFARPWITGAIACLLCAVPGTSASAQAPPAGQEQTADSIMRRLHLSGAGRRYDLGSDGSWSFHRPVRLRALREVPATLGGSLAAAVAPRNAGNWALVAASSLALYAGDEYVLDKTRMLARHAGLPPNHPSANLRFAGMKLPVPTTFASGLYFLGDGMTDVLVASGFLVHGLVHDDNRARTTASQILTGLVSLGVYTQVLKHSFGRQTPSEATVARGEWRPFPPLGDYNRNVPGYDAMPSGHLAAAFSTVEIIALNYPETRWVRPVAYPILSVLAATMVNNGVHWASDYPLALLIGGGVARVVTARGRVALDPAGRAPTAAITPIVAPGRIGVRIALPH
jgi:PAP2 superfamily